ncbi:MAG: nucleotide exchange factor GrpE [Candidatus Shikimatogenerans bostrichidophilus]|nr:MAG: nucleotide exchange factor GrpE [Candidatus Shikimatogenerans bostrichidophilus]
MNKTNDLKNKISDCKKKVENKKNKIDKLKKKIDILKEKFIRTLAEFDNFKKRNDKEKKDLFKFYIGDIIKKILPILDDFDRLIKEEKINNKNGIFLIYKNFKKILENNGLKKIKVNKGDIFNSDYHYAISQIKVENKNMKKKVVKILEDGYYLYDKIIRCTKVIVGY